MTQISSEFDIDTSIFFPTFFDNIFVFNSSYYSFLTYLTLYLISFKISQQFFLLRPNGGFNPQTPPCLRLWWFKFLLLLFFRSVHIQRPELQLSTSNWSKKFEGSTTYKKSVSIRILCKDNIHTYIIYTCRHTYVHTYIHTDLCTDTCICSLIRSYITLESDEERTIPQNSIQRLCTWSQKEGKKRWIMDRHDQRGLQRTASDTSWGHRTGESGEQP